MDDAIPTAISRASSLDPLALSYDDGDTQHPLSSPRLRKSSPLPGAGSADKRATTSSGNTPAPPRRRGRPPAGSSPAAQRSAQKRTTPTTDRAVQTIESVSPGLGGQGQVSTLLTNGASIGKGAGVQALLSGSPTRTITQTIMVPLKGPDSAPSVPRRRGRPRKNQPVPPAQVNVSQEADQKTTTSSDRRVRQPTPGIVVGTTVVEDVLAGNEVEHEANWNSVGGQATAIPTEALPSVENFDFLDTVVEDAFKAAEDLGTADLNGDSRAAPSQLDGSRDDRHRNGDVAAPRTKTKAMSLDFTKLTPLHKKAKGTSRVVTPPKNSPSTRLKRVSERVPTPRKPKGWRDQDEDEQPEQTKEPELIRPISLRNKADQPQGLDGANEAFSPSQDRAGTMPIGWDADLPEDDGSFDDDSPANGDAVMPDDTVALNQSAMEGEGFSMVSIDALKSQRELAESQAASVPPGAQAKTAREASPIATVKYPVLVEPVDEPEAERQVKSMQRPKSSPKQRPTLASPLQQPPSRKISPVVRAGSVLQEALSSPPGPGQSRSPPAGQRMFSGFGSRTRREMRRSVAVGELLARSEPAGAGTTVEPARESSVMAGRLPTPEGSLLSAQIHVSKRAPGGVTNGHPGQRATYDDMSWKPTTLPRRNPSQPTEEGRREANAMSWRPTTPPTTNDSAERELRLSRGQQLELQYQQERDEVIRQAEEASASQIVIIDSSIIDSRRGATRAGAVSRMGARDEDGDLSMRDASIRPVDNEATAGSGHDQKSPTVQLEDIFLDEADRSLEESFNAPRRGRTAPEYKPPRDDTNRMTRNPHSLLRELPKYTPDFADILGSDDRPTRAKLPRDWRRTSGSELLYTDESGATPQKAAAGEVSRKRPGSALGESPAKAADIPTVFKRIRRSPLAGQAKTETRRRMAPSPPSSPEQESNMASSPPQPVTSAAAALRGVRTAAAAQMPESETRYFSSDSDSDIGEPPVAREDLTIHAEDPEDDLEDGLQDDLQEDIEEDVEEDVEEGLEENLEENLEEDLEVERGLAGRTRRGRANLSVRSHSHVSIATESDQSEEDDDESEDMAARHSSARASQEVARYRLKPRKNRSRSNLFSPAVRLSRTEEDCSIAPSSSQHEQQYATDQVSARHSVEYDKSQPGLLSRALSWFWPPSYFSSDGFSMQTLVWGFNNNHRILLEHYYNLATGRPTKGPRLPPAYYDDPIPDALLRSYIGTEFRRVARCDSSCPRDCEFMDTLTEHGTRSKTFAAAFSETSARIAWAFMTEVATRGVPLMRGRNGNYPLLTGPDGEDVVDKAGIVRDAYTGRVTRRRERWGARYVAQQVFVVDAEATIWEEAGYT